MKSTSPYSKTENPSNSTSNQDVPPATQSSEDYCELLDSITGELNRALENDDFGGSFYNSHEKKVVNVWTLNESKTKSKIESAMKKYESQGIQVEYLTAKYSVKQLTDYRLDIMIDYSKNRILPETLLGFMLIIRPHKLSYIDQQKQTIRYYGGLLLLFPPFAMAGIFIFLHYFYSHFFIFSC